MFALQVVIVIALLCSIDAFSTSSSTVRSTMTMSSSEAVQMSKSVPFLVKPKNLDGLVGDAGFDPLGFSDSFDIKWLREAELKHCRVSMLAVTGWLIQSAGVHFPSPNGIYDTVNPIDAVFHVGASPLLQIFLGIGALESINHSGKMGMTNMHQDSEREVGQFSLPIYGAKLLKGKTSEEVSKLKLQELKNGRLAMIAIGGLVHQTLISGTEAFGAIPHSF